MTNSRAVVQVGARQYELNSFPLPEIGADDGLLRVDRNAICGSDVQMYNGDVHENNFGYPTIPGHEPVGTIVQLGDNAAKRWGARIGDRVILEGTIPCGECRFCKEGTTTSCIDRRNLGYTRSTVPPHLWGGFAEYLYMHPRAKVHRISRDVPLDVAATFNVLACGLHWGIDIPGTREGDTVVILGAGQRGLACLLAVKSVGARTVFITGLTRDRHKLDIAERLGADVAVDVQKQNIVDVVRERTGGVMADVVIDLAPDAPQTVLDAIDCARSKATIVLAGLKGDRPLQLMTDEIVRKALTIKGAWGKPARSYDDAIKLMETGKYPLHLLHTHSFPLDRAADAIEVLGGKEGVPAICVSVSPHGD